MRRMRRIAVGLIVSLTFVGSGCTHVQLRKNTVGQAGTLTDIYQQQVLDNLAMFVCDYNSLPHFAFPTSGTSQMTDSGRIGGAVSWDKLGFLGASVAPEVSRQAEESWSLTPLADPRVLELMRCSYQRAVQSCFPDKAESGACPSCQKRFADYYTGTPDGKIPAPGSDKDTGIVTSECLSRDCCWFYVACKKCLPRYTHCRHVGHHCGVYVCVPPGRGQDELTKLTLVILDFAFNDPATPDAPPTEQVVRYFTANGNPATQTTAEMVVTGTRPAGTVGTSRTAAAAAPGWGTLPRRGPRPNPATAPNVLEQRQQLRATGMQ